MSKWFRSLYVISFKASLLRLSEFINKKLNKLTCVYNKISKLNKN